MRAMLDIKKLMWVYINGFEFPMINHIVIRTRFMKLDNIDEIYSEI